MSSPTRALAHQAAWGSAPWPSTDASLAGTCETLPAHLALRGPQLPRLRRLSFEERPHQIAGGRKSVSFSLRVRGPGSAYNSPSPQQPLSGQVPSYLVDEAAAAAARTGAPSEDCSSRLVDPSEAQDGSTDDTVVRRLFRAVQGYASSPEPQPKVYPGWHPQPKGPPADARPGVIGASDPQPAASSMGATAHLNAGLNPSDQAFGPSIDAGIKLTALETMTLARVRLALNCASAADALPAAPRSPVARGSHSDVTMSSRSAAWRADALTAMTQEQGANSPLRQQPKWQQQPYAQPIRQSARFAPLLVAAGASTSSTRASNNHASMPAEAVVGTAGGGSPLDIASSTSRAYDASAPSAPQPLGFPGSSLCDRGSATDGSVASAASPRCAPVCSQVSLPFPTTQPDDLPEATFEQVHMLLMSLNLPTSNSEGRHGSSQEEPVHANVQLDPMGVEAAAAARASPPRPGPESLGIPADQHVSSSIGEDRMVTALRLHFDQQFATPSSGRRRPQEGQGATGPEWFSAALLSTSTTWLQSLAQAAARRRRDYEQELSDLWQHIREAQLERRHAESFLVATRLGVSRARLAKLEALVAASGAPPAVTAALLTQLEHRLRLKLALRVLQLRAAARAQLVELVGSRQEAAGPILAAAWLCWRRAAKFCASIRGRAQAVIVARQRVLLARMLLGWQAVVHRAMDLRQRENELASCAACRTRGRCLRAWRAVCMRYQLLRDRADACQAFRLRRLLVAWRATAARLKLKGRQRRQAEGHYRSRLLLASLAHWRFLHVSSSVSRVWEAALLKRRNLQLLGRAMRVWHFYARRCRQLIQQLAGQRAAASAGATPVVDEASLPLPLRLATLPAIIRRVLSAARQFMLAMSDELLHLRAFMRFSVPAWSLPSGQKLTLPAAASARLAAKTAWGDLMVGSSRTRSTMPYDAGRRGAADGAVQGSVTSADGCGGGGSMGRRASPRLLISGQWQHKRQVLLLMAQLRRVERMMADVDARLNAAERNGRLARIELQQQADGIQRRTATSREAFAAAQAERQQVESSLEQLDKEAHAVAGYLGRCRATSEAAEEHLRRVEREIAEAETHLGRAHASVADAAAREQELKAQHATQHAAAADAARQLPDPSLVHAQEAERRGRQRLLAAQRRLSEALQLKAALMAHWREMQVVAASAPRYAAQRHALRVGEAQQQVVEAAKVVSLTELEVQELLTAVEALARATREAKGADDEAQAVAAAVVAQAAEVAERAAAAARDTQAAAEAEQRARGAVAALQLQLRELRRAHAQELPQTPARQEVMLLEPLRAREQRLQADLVSCQERAEAAHRELQAALSAAAELSQRVEAAEVSYRAELLRLQPARPKLEQSALQLRSRLAAYPSELVRQVRRVVDEYNVEAHQDAQGDWTVANLPPGWDRVLLPGLLAAAANSAASDDESLSPGRWNNLAARTRRYFLGPSCAPSLGPRRSQTELQRGGSASSPTQPDLPGPSLRPTPAAAPQLPLHTASGTGSAHPETTRHSQPRTSPTVQGPNLHSMSAAQLTHVARSVLGSAAVRGVEVRTHESPIRGDPRNDDALAGVAVAGLLQGAVARAAGDASPPSGRAPSGRGPTEPHAAPSCEDAEAGASPSASRLRQDHAQGRGQKLWDWWTGHKISSCTVSLRAPPGSRGKHDRRHVDREGDVLTTILAADLAATEQPLVDWHFGGATPLSAYAEQTVRWALAAGGGSPSKLAVIAAPPPARRLLRLFERVLGQKVGEVLGDGSGNASPSSAESDSPSSSRGAEIGDSSSGGGGADDDSSSGGGGADDDSSSGGAGGGSCGDSRGGGGYGDGSRGEDRGYGSSSGGGADDYGGSSGARDAGYPSSSGGGGDTSFGGSRDGGGAGYGADRSSGADGYGGSSSGGGADGYGGSSSGGADGYRGSSGGGSGADGDVSGTGGNDDGNDGSGGGGGGGIGGGSGGNGDGRATGVPGGANMMHLGSGQHVAMLGSGTAPFRMQPHPHEASTSCTAPFPVLPSYSAANVDQQPLPFIFTAHASLSPGVHLGDLSKLAAVAQCPSIPLNPKHEATGLSKFRATMQTPADSSMCPERVSLWPPAGQHPAAKSTGNFVALGLGRHVDDRELSEVAQLESEAPLTRAAVEVLGRALGEGSYGAAPDVRDLDEAACLFYLRELCRKALQGFRQYIARLDALVGRLYQAASQGRMQWALAQLRLNVVAPTAIARGFAATRACRRSLAWWRLRTEERRRVAASLLLARRRNHERWLRGCLLGWAAWCDRQGAKRRVLTAAHKQRLRWLLRRWRLALQALGGARRRKVAATQAYSRALLRRCVHYWSHTVRAHQLLRRVFATAESMWDECADVLLSFGQEYGTLRSAFNRLRRYCNYRLNKRQERINEQAAIAFRTSLLRVRVFSAWQAVVVMAWQDRYVARKAMRFLHEWRRHAHNRREMPRSRCSSRRRLRARGFPAGEADVRRCWLKRCALAALLAAKDASYRHYAHGLLRRAFSAMTASFSQRLSLVVACRRLRHRALLRQWQDLAAAGACKRKALQIITARRGRRVLLLALSAWRALIGHAQETRHRMARAALHYKRCVALRVLQRLSTCSRTLLELAKRHGLTRRLSRCVQAWRAHAASTRAKTDALLRTLTTIDHSGLLGQSSAPLCHASRQLLRQEASAPAAITGALLLSPHALATSRLRYQADCHVTAAPSNGIGRASAALAADAPDSPVQPLCDNATAPVLGEEVATPASSGLAYHVEEVRGRDGRVAQVLTLEPRLVAAEVRATVRFNTDGGFGTGAALPGGFAVAECGTVSDGGRAARAPMYSLQAPTAQPPRHRSTLESSSDAASPRLSEQLGWCSTRSDFSSPSPSMTSSTALHELPNNVNDMDAATVRLWRHYAQQQLAVEWHRRVLLTRVMLALRTIRKAAKASKGRQRTKNAGIRTVSNLPKRRGR